MKDLIVSSRSTAISLIFPEGNTATFDPSGRPVALYINGHFYGRGLDGRLKEKSWNQSVDVFDRFIRDVPQEQAISLLQNLYADIKRARARISASREKEIVSRLLSWEGEKLKDDETNFETIYKPIHILPPDKYFPIVIQVTDGCPWNKCTFCDFYKERAFRVHSIDEVNAHAREVASFLGDGAKLRDSIFLADANAIAVPTRQLLAMIANLKTIFPQQTRPRGGFYSFGDVPALLGKREADLKLLRQAGLRRVYIGMESGADDVRQRIQKPATGEEVVRAVHRLKGAGLQVGVIVLLGIGGDDLREKHVHATTDALNRMGLSEGDLIYFSPLQPSSKPNGSPSAPFPGRDSARKDQCRLEFRRMRDELRTQSSPHAPQIAVYDVREFVY